MKNSLTALLLGMAGLSAQAQDFYNIDAIQEIRLIFIQNNWDDLLDSLKNADDQDFLIAASAEINGQIFDSVGVKYKGNNSYDPDNAKNPLHIELDFVQPNQNYLGIKDIKLGNAYSDPSFVREALGYEILGRYADAPRANFTRVWINSQYWGVFVNVESVNKRFARNHFHTGGQNPFFKCNPDDYDGPGTGGNYPDLVYDSPDSTDYYAQYKLESDHGWRELLTLMDTLKNHPAGLPALLDVDRALWMLAFNNAFVNLDSYTGAYAQNYYLYRDDNGRWLPVVWDINLGFGAFPLLNPPGGTGGPPLTLTQMQQLDPLAQAGNPNRPLIRQTLADPVWQRMYLAHLRTLLQENADYADRAAGLQAGIAADVQSDPKKFFSYADFQNNLDLSVDGGFAGAVPGLTELMGPRFDYLAAHPLLAAEPPAVAGLSAEPAGNNQIRLTATLTTPADAVLAGWRFDSAAVFQKIPLLDDGLHGDGAAGDGIFGGVFPILGPHAQYFLYAENASAGRFLPPRAEFNFFTYEVTLPVATAGQVVLNEFLADNENGERDEAGEREDWLELFNTTGQTLSLEGLYLSDKTAEPDKWAFPAGAFLPAGGYQIVWLDENPGQGPYHANFKLDAGGETLLLSAGMAPPFEQVFFGQQQPDVSFGRFPNGTGPFTTMPTTFKGPNSLSSGINASFSTKIKIFPNPATDVLRVETDAPLGLVQAFDALGRTVFFREINDARAVDLNFGHLPPGLYGLKVGAHGIQRILVRR